MPAAIREGVVAKQPYLAIDDVDGLISLAQMSAIELHPWGAGEDTPNRPDRIVFDLDPGEGVPWTEVIKATHEVRERLQRLGLASFCRTTGGKGLHLVVPLRPEADWDRVKPFCRAFAEAMTQEFPDRYLAHLKIADRRGKVLVDCATGWARRRSPASAPARVQARRWRPRLPGRRSRTSSILLPSPCGQCPNGSTDYWPILGQGLHRLTKPCRMSERLGRQGRGQRRRPRRRRYAPRENPSSLWHRSQDCAGDLRVTLS